MAAIPFVIPPAPMPLPIMPAGHYGISYDIFSRATEDNLPNGWHAHRSEYPTMVLTLLAP
jgi:hypothetical protein